MSMFLGERRDLLLLKEQRGVRESKVGRGQGNGRDEARFPEVGAVTVIPLSQGAVSQPAL